MKNTNVIAALLFLVGSSFTAFAQKSTVLAAFAKHGIDPSILNAENIQEPDNYAFDFKQTTTTAGKQTTTIAQFDPAKPKEEQWTVVSIDGKSPSKGDISSFRKNQAKSSSTTQMDDASYGIVKESPDYLIISYKQDVNTIPKDASFMKDCRSYMTINLKTKKLEQVQAVNEKPVKIKILNAEKFELTIKYIKNEESKRYFPASQDLNMDAKFMGQAVNVQTSTTYTNYTKK